MPACIAPLSIETPEIVHLRSAFRKEEATKFMDVPCGSCPTCLSKRSGQWIFRLKKERYQAKSAYFITLTYDDENLPLTECGKPNLYYKDYQLYIKRLRKREKTNQKIRYYAVGEYGSETLRPHYHAIIYNVSNADNLYHAWKHPDTRKPLGHMSIDSVTGASIAYVCKYVQKQIKFKDRNDPRTREKALISKGLGQNFITPAMVKHLKAKLEPYLTLPGGERLAIPRYYKDKIFTQVEKNIINSKAKQYINEGQENRSFHEQNESKKELFRRRDKIAYLKRNNVR